MNKVYTGIKWSFGRWVCCIFSVILSCNAALNHRIGKATLNGHYSDNCQFVNVKFENFKLTLAIHLKKLFVEKRKSKDIKYTSLVY